MKKAFFIIICVCFLCIYTFGEDIEQTNKAQNPIVSLSMLFHNIGWNALHSITYNYGLNFIGAGLETWAFIETGLDWKWRNTAYKNNWLSQCGIPGLYTGYAVPGLAPIAAYITGRIIKDERLQITGLALAQALILTLGIQSVLKMSTGRALPGIVNELDHTRSQRTDNFSDEFNWFNMNFIGGWPSSHTANAFAAAAVIAEIYYKNIPLKIGVYTYAVLMGLGKSVSVHWASEVIAGALIGYAIGKTVGISFRRLTGSDLRESRLSLQIAPNGIFIRAEGLIPRPLGRYKG
ncbi:MAG: phosphatase PAP2 family protein [Treponema sp.]|jgi:membrane-associated phospholipid phosphatase|nr:phosphatase PAP2 family protein [Treponema sp.]